MEKSAVEREPRNRQIENAFNKLNNMVNSLDDLVNEIRGADEKPKSEKPDIPIRAMADLIAGLPDMLLVKVEHIAKIRDELRELIL